MGIVCHSSVPRKWSRHRPMISNLTHRAARALRGRGFDMSRVPDGHVLRRMWAKAGAEEAAPGETKPPEVSFGPSDVIVIGGEPATVEIETEHVDPEIGRAHV